MNEVVPVGADRLRDVVDVDTWAFPSQHPLDDQLGWPYPLPWGRTYGVEDHTQPGRLVAFHASYPFSDTPVAGARLPIAGLTWVCVHPQWRRQGLLRSMMDAHFAHCLERGEPVSMLYAAEPAIYGRFGYGLAARQVTLTIPRGAARRCGRSTPPGSLCGSTTSTSTRTTVWSPAFTGPSTVRDG